MRRKRSLEFNPVMLAYAARSHRVELIETAIACELAIAALAAGNATDTDKRQLQYMALMTQQLGRQGFMPEGLDKTQLHDLCTQALRIDLDALRAVSAIHEAQTEAATHGEYTRARMAL